MPPTSTNWWQRGNRLTGSRLSLARKCTAWTLPSVPMPPEVEDPFCKSGSALHTLTELHLEDGPERAEQHALALLVGEEMRPSDAEKVVDWYQAAQSHLDSLPETIRTEVPFAYDYESDTARELPGGARRDYSMCLDGEIPTTLDAFWIQEEEGEAVACVADWETGWTGYKGKISESLTMALGALCVARSLGCSHARVAFWRVGPSGVRVSEHLLTPEELDARAFEISVLMDDIHGDRVLDLEFLPIPPSEPQPGPWCHEQFCPALGTCPVAQQAIAETELVQIARVPAEREKPTPAPLDMRAIMAVEIRDHDHARSVLHRVRMVEAGAKAIRAALNLYTDRHGPIPLDKGRVFGPRTTTKDRLRATPESLAILADVGELDVLAPRSLSKSRLTKVLGAAASREVLARLRDAGAVEATTTIKHEEHKAPKAPKAPHVQTPPADEPPA